MNNCKTRKENRVQRKKLTSLQAKNQTAASLVEQPHHPQGLFFFLKIRPQGLFHTPFAKKVLNPEIKLSCPSNNSFTLEMTPTVSVLQD